MKVYTRGCMIVGGKEKVRLWDSYFPVSYTKGGQKNVIINENEYPIHGNYIEY